MSQARIWRRIASKEIESAKALGLFTTGMI
jgi:hypothetical protein